MKRYFLLLLVLTFSGCEKDDICDANTITTPQISHFVLWHKQFICFENVTNLKITGEGMAEGFSLMEALLLTEVPSRLWKQTLMWPALVLF
jgi:hypothetical protein